MSTVALGFVPIQLSVHLTRDADFAATLRTSDSSNFPSGTAVTLELQKSGSAASTWAATVAADSAVWNVDKAVVNALVPRTRYAARVIYNDGTGTDLVWFSGSVVWHG